MDMFLFYCPSDILTVRDAKFFAYLESFSSKFNCAMIQIIGAVSTVFQQLVFTEFLGSKVRNRFGANFSVIEFGAKKVPVLSSDSSPSDFSDFHETWPTQELASKVSDFINRVKKKK